MLDFLQKNKSSDESFWALLIEPEWITSSIWKISNSKVEIIATSPATRWEDDLVGSIDTSLSACSQNLPEDAPDPTKTVFGVPNSWLSEGNIKPEYLDKLKRICTDLSLTPTGFVVLSEAISHFIKYEEESPLSGIVIGVSSEALDLSIFNSGKLIGTTTILRSISIEEDLVEGISRLSGELETLPSRIILFNQKESELEEIKATLNDTDWNKIGMAASSGTSKFIHAPKIEILEPSKKILAVSLAGGSELGDVSGVVGVNEEVDTVTESMPIEEVSNIEEPDGVTAEDLGFSVEPDISTKNVQEAVIVPNQPIHGNTPKFSNIASKFSNFKKPNFNLPKMKIGFGDSKPLLMGGILIMTLIIVGFVLWWFLPKATVTVYVSPKKIEESTSVMVGKDLDDEVVEVELESEKTKSTTGTKVVGEKSKGTVEIRNNTSEPIKLPAGTILISGTDLKFVTTKSASISGSLLAGTYGKESVDVEANTIGSEYNLAKDEVLKVSNYPKGEIAAFSTNSFNGGSSRQISAVSEDDRKKILKDLGDELLTEANTKLSEKITDDQILIESSFNKEILEEDYSNKVGDEATNLKLSLKVKVSSTVVQKKDLLEIAKSNLESSIPSGFVLRDDQLKYDFTNSDIEGKFDIKISANLLPSIDTTSIAKQIAGRYPKLAEDFLASVPGFINAEIRLYPTLKGKLGTLPHIPKNITVEIAAE